MLEHFSVPPQQLSGENAVPDGNLGMKPYLPEVRNLQPQFATVVLAFLTEMETLHESSGEETNAPA